MLMAGDAAVRPFFKASEDLLAVNRANDTKAAMALLARRGLFDPDKDRCRLIARSERPAFIERQRQRAIKWAARELLGGYLPIKAVAEALLFRGTLSRDEVAAIVLNASVIALGREGRLK